MAVRFSPLGPPQTSPQLPKSAAFPRRCASVTEVASPQGRPRLRFATPLLSGAVRLGKLPAPSWALCPRYPLGACLGARTPRMHSIGWVLAPRLRPANVLQGPFPGLRPPGSVRIAGDIPDVCAFYREECPPSRRAVCAGSALGCSLREAPLRLRLLFGAHAAGRSGCAASEGDSVRGSPFDEPERLRLTSLRPPPAAAPPDPPETCAFRQAGGAAAA